MVGNSNPIFGVQGRLRGSSGFGKGGGAQFLKDVGPSRDKASSLPRASSGYRSSNLTGAKFQTEETYVGGAGGGRLQLGTQGQKGKIVSIPPLD